MAKVSTTRSVAYSSKRGLSLDPRMRADEAAKRVHRALLQTIQLNEAGVRQGLGSESLHDFRVALRRTRTCLAQMKGVFPGETVDRFRREFSWLGSISGPTRDLDVHLLHMGEYEARLPKKIRPSLAPLWQFLHMRRRIEQQRLAKALQSARYRTLIGQWQRFLEQPIREGTTLPNARRPILEVASGRVERRFRRVLKKGRAIGPSSPTEALHRLRIECKKLRYLLEFFRSLFDPRDLGALVKELKKLQDHLGTFNDLQVQQLAMRRFAKQMRKAGMGTAGSLDAMEELVERLGARQAKERKRFDKRFSRFAGKENGKRIRRLLERARTVEGRTPDPRHEEAGGTARVKTLLLLRHGKSDWDAKYGADHVRPLANRGKRAASLMGRYLARLDQVPDQVVCSSAVRAKETLRLAAEAGGWSCPVTVAEELYQASPGRVLELIRDTKDSVSRVLLVGHEPTWSLLAGRLIGKARVEFPTAAMARIDLPVARWGDAGFGKGILVWLVTPKLLARIGWPDRVK
jgi:CHAD domain-containing protein/phosphohistidine phosphatase SixA